VLGFAHAALLASARRRIEERVLGGRGRLTGRPRVPGDRSLDRTIGVRKPGPKWALARPSRRDCAGEALRPAL